MSEISFTCSKCGVEIETDESLAGSVAQCPNCNSTVMIPMPGIRPGMKIASYEIIRRLGSGGMGEVWLATQTSMERKVALKILSPALTSDKEFVDRFLKEVRTAAKLEHPNIVTAFDAGVDGNIYYLAMSYIDGVLLDNLLTIDKVIPEKEALRIVRSIADALCYAWNEFRILHRDIKPANIMLDSRKTAKLLDMGISKSLSEEKGLTMTGVIVGTPYYMSPEQARADAAIDCRSDIYSLGATLYHLVTGEVPYEATTAMGILMKHVMDPFPPPQEKNPEISDACSVMLEAMMAKKPEERQKTWEEVIKDIDLVLSGQFPATARPSAGKSIIMQETNSQKISRKKALEKRYQPVKAPVKAALAHKHPAAAPPPAQEKKSEKKGQSHSLPPAVLITIGVTLCILIVCGAAMLFSGKKEKAPEKKHASTSAKPTADKEVVNPNEKPASVKAANLSTPSNNGTGGTVPSTNTAPIDDATAEKMINAAIEELKKKNPAQKEWNVSLGYGGKRHLLLSNNPELADISPLKGLPLCGLYLNGTKVTDISVLKGMPLTKLGLYESKVSDISVLKGMPLTELMLYGCSNISDISVLKGMQLTSLKIDRLPVSDISVLKGMPLTVLHLYGTKVTDISVLKGMPLVDLNLYGLQIADISVIKGMQLAGLVLSFNQVTDISILAGMPLTYLSLAATKVTDISVLKGMPLKYLELEQTQITDISALKGMPLTKLDLNATQVSDISVLKGMTLTRLMLVCPVTDISVLKDMPLTSLQLGGTITDISALKGMPLTYLELRARQVSDISALKGMPLTGIWLCGTQVSDISVLKGMPLEILDLYGCKDLNDLMPLADCKQLKKLSIPEQCKNIDFLRKLPNLEMLDNKMDTGRSKRTPDEFWKDWDAANEKTPAPSSGGTASTPSSSGPGGAVPSTNAAASGVQPKSNPDKEYLIVDLSNGNISYSGTVPTGLLTNNSFKTDKLVMRRVPAGDFMMSSPPNEKGRLDNETQHKVELTKDFYIGVFEVTQGQWEKVMKANPSIFKDVGKDAPIENVSWEDCQNFMKELNGKKSSALAFRLPTEAEWEYASRGGKASKGFEYSGSGTLDEVAWFKDNSGGKTHPVGKKKANELGLYDMSGNVWEWCSDWFGEYSKELEKDPQGAKSGGKRILRGGEWNYFAGFCRSANRSGNAPTDRFHSIGFRLVLPAGQK